MTTSVALLATLITLTGCHFRSSYYDSYSSYNSIGGSSRSRTDEYGTYYYDREGYRIYTVCRSRSALPRDQCRYSGYGRDIYSSSRPYDSYGRYDDYYYGSRGKVNVGSGRFEGIRNEGMQNGDSRKIGKGTFRVYSGGRDAALRCEFPRGSHIVSNIVWEKAGDSRFGYNRYNSNSLRGMRVRSLGSFGSELVIEDFRDRDFGVYRCIGTRKYDNYLGRPSYGSSYGRGYDRTESVYMEVQFYPEGRGYTGGFDGRDNYYPRDDYWSGFGGYRAAALSTSEDKIVAKNDEREVSKEREEKN